eukprot:scaffold245757_cov51-Attheya_sp.AAC.1
MILRMIRTIHTVYTKREDSILKKIINHCKIIHSDVECSEPALLSQVNHRLALKSDERKWPIWYSSRRNSSLFFVPGNRLAVHIYIKSLILA